MGMKTGKAFITGVVEVDHFSSKMPPQRSRKLQLIIKREHPAGLHWSILHCFGKSSPSAGSSVKEMYHKRNCLLLCKTRSLRWRTFVFSYFAGARIQLKVCKHVFNSREGILIT